MVLQCVSPIMKIWGVGKSYICNCRVCQITNLTSPVQLDQKLPGTGLSGVFSVLCCLLSVAITGSGIQAALGLGCKEGGLD